MANTIKNSAESPAYENNLILPAKEILFLPRPPAKINKTGIINYSERAININFAEDRRRVWEDIRLVTMRSIMNVGRT